MGTYNDTLLGDVLSDFNPLQADDVLLVSAACACIQLHIYHSQTVSGFGGREQSKDTGANGTSLEKLRTYDVSSCSP
jgi:hypothetical protein